MSDMTNTAKWTDFSSFDSEQLIASVNERLPRWVTLLLVLAIAWQLARVLWMLVPAPAAGDPVARPAQTTGEITTQAGGQANVRMIAAAHLFGEATPEAATEQPISGGENVDSLPDARVNFTVKGTVTATDSRSSVAIIADTSKEEKVYRIGDPIQAGTTLHAVNRDGIVLNQNGSLTKLMLPKEFPNGAPANRRTTRTVNRTANSSSQSIQNVVAQNVSKLADVIRPTPYFVGGQQQGYRVYPGRDRKQFAALGLRPGDLIKDIDGAALTDPTQAMEIFQNLGNAEEVSVTVERNGQPQTLILKTSQLALNKDK